MSQITISPAMALGLPLDITNPLEIVGATQNSLVIGDVGGQLTSLGVANDGEIPIGSTGNAPSLTTITAGTNINITNGPGSITVTATGSGIGPEFEDDVFRIIDDGDNTKKIAFQADQITTGTVRTITMCDQDLSLISPSFPGSVTSELDLTVTSGNFNLPSTNAALSEGVIEVNGNRFLHSFGTDNIFMGTDSGNGTLTGSNNIGIGTFALDSTTSGDDNTAIGIASAAGITTGSQNTGFGSGSLAALTTGDNNTSIGYSSLLQVTTGSDNIALGNNSASQLTLADSDNILIGHVGSAGLGNTIRIGTTGTGAGQQDTCYIAGIYGETPGAASQSMLIDTNGLTTTIGAATNGELIIGSTGATPVLSTLTAGSNVNIANGAGSITISSTGNVTWNEVTGTSQAAAVNNGYVCNNASLVTVTLPDTAAFGSIVRIAGKGDGGWKVAQNAGETIYWDESTATTTGATGYLQSTDDYNYIELLCITADTDWLVTSVKGNITVA